MDKTNQADSAGVSLSQGLEFQQSYEQRLLDFVVEQRGGMCGDIDLNTSLLDTGILDSLFIQLLLTYIEDEFDVRLPPEDVRPETFSTVREIASLVLLSQNKSTESVSVKVAKAVAVPGFVIARV